MDAVKNTSPNAGTSEDDALRADIESFYKEMLMGIASVAVSYAIKVRDSEVECTEETFYEHIKLVPRVEEGNNRRIPMGKSLAGTRTAAPRAKATTKAADLTPTQLQMYSQINAGTWDWQWEEDKCQRFITSGGEMNKFCGKKTPNGSYFCVNCSAMTSIIKLAEKFDDGEYTPKKWRDLKIKGCSENASKRVRLDTGQTVKKAPGAVSRSPPTAKPPPTNGPSLPRQTSSPVVYTIRTYVGKDKPTDSLFYWCKVGKNGFVFDENKDLVGLVSVNMPQSTITEADEEATEAFDTISKNLKIPSLAKAQPPARSEKAPTLSRPPVASNSSESSSTQEEE
jgi:hypothetical protein